MSEENAWRDVVSIDLNVDLIGAVIREFAGAYRNVSSYPKGHPVVVQACERAADMLVSICANHTAITLGVARKTLMLGEQSLGTLVPASRNFVRTLAYHGVAVITFRKGLTASEIEGFCQILKEKRTQISSNGGLEQVVHGAGIQHLNVCSIQYDAFQAAVTVAEEEGREKSLWRRSLWETFLVRIMHGSEVPFLPDSGMDSQATPEEVIGLLLNRSREFVPRIADVLEELIHEIGGLGHLSSEEKSCFSNIGEFIGGLDPDLRRQFFDNVLQACQQHDFSVMEIVPFLPTSTALELFTCSLESNVKLPSHIMDSMAQLADALEKDSSLDATGSPLMTSGTEDRLHVVFREDIVETFVPTDYLETLKTLVACQKFPEPSPDDFRELIGTLADDRIESAVSRIILECLSGAGPEQLVALKRNLHDLSRYFLEVGDFHSLQNVYLRLCVLPFQNSELADLKDEVLATFRSSSFIAEVLNGVENWGKDKFDEIGELIQAIGQAFDEPLLDRLAEEEGLTFRRFYLAQLLKVSGRVKDAACARLGDMRWYFIRNLVVILEHTGDPSVLTYLRKVADFPHPKVRQKVIEAFLFFGDPEGDKLLLNDLSSSDLEVRQSAIQLAGKSREPKVLGALLLILGKKGLSTVAVTEKKATIQALAEIGDSRVLPLFARMLAVRPFLRWSRWKILKMEILQSLVKYADPSAKGLLEKVAASGNGELARHAARLSDCSGGRI